MDRVTISIVFEIVFRFIVLYRIVDEDGILLHQIFATLWTSYSIAVRFIYRNCNGLCSPMNAIYKQVWISSIVCHLPIDSREGINDFIAIIFRNIPDEQRHYFEIHLKIYFIVTKASKVRNFLKLNFKKIEFQI